MANTVINIHYHTSFGDFITIRGNEQGLSWEVGIEATWKSENAEDVWALSFPVMPDSPQEIHFKPLINDEVWAKGNDYIVSAGKTIDIYPFFFSTQGSIFKTHFYSHSLGNSRKLAVYLPPSYEENTYKRYPVILFQDGHNLFDTEDSFCGETWHLRESLDNLCCDRGIRECIVVGIYPIEREWEYLPTFFSGNGGGADNYLDVLLGEVKPSADQHLRVSKVCGIAGSSYGGVISLYGWISRPDDFEFCGAFSPSLSWDNGVLFDIVKQNVRNIPPNHKLYMDCGTIQDDSYTVIELAKFLQSNESTLHKDQFKLVVAEGHDHSEKSWAVRAPDALAFLLADPLRAQ